jgi:hypothetical protein
LRCQFAVTWHGQVKVAQLHCELYQTDWAAALATNIASASKSRPYHHVIRSF